VGRRLARTAMGMAFTRYPPFADWGRGGNGRTVAPGEESSSGSSQADLSTKPFIADRSSDIVRVILIASRSLEPVKLAIITKRTRLPRLSAPSAASECPNALRPLLTGVGLRCHANRLQTDPPGGT
jgi:hypothetical protein